MSPDGFSPGEARKQARSTGQQVGFPKSSNGPNTPAGGSESAKVGFLKAQPERAKHLCRRLGIGESWISQN
eukprot:12260466-Alexandrium_andersonii.AAC.1